MPDEELGKRIIEYIKETKWPKPIPPKIKHGKSNTRVYHIWMNMIQRCVNPNNASYRYYGGRGITVCEEWREFTNFYRDMGDPPLNYTIERINNNAGYYPENCKWATWFEQNNNRRKKNST